MKKGKKCQRGNAKVGKYCNNKNDSESSWN